MRYMTEERRPGLAIGHPMILAFEEKQGAIVVCDAAEHFAHDNGVIATFVTLDDLAFEMADSAV